MNWRAEGVKSHIFLSTVFFFMLSVHLASPLANPSDESKLVKKIFSNYNKVVRPAKDSVTPIQLTFHARVIQVIDFDEKNQVLTWNLWIRQAWKDYRLQWNQSEYRLERLVLNPLWLWVPDIYLYNNAQENYRGFDFDVQDGVVVTPDGNMVWWTQAVMKSTCKFHVRYFPFDEQKCELQFGSWTHSGFQVNLSLYTDKGDVSLATENGEWVLADFTAVRNVVYYKCCPEPYPSVSYTLTARRRSKFYLSNFMLPCTLIAFISVLAFCLPYKSGERVNLLITSLLSLTIFSLMISDMIPATPDGTPLFSQFMIAILIEISIAVTVISFVIGIESKMSPPPTFVRRFLNKYLAYLVGLRKNDGCPSDDNMNLPMDDLKDGTGNFNLKEIDIPLKEKLQGKNPEGHLDILSIGEEEFTPDHVTVSCSEHFKDKMLQVLDNIAGSSLEELKSIETMNERLDIASKMDTFLHAFFTLVVLSTIIATLLIPPELNL